MGNLAKRLPPPQTPQRMPQRMAQALAARKQLAQSGQRPAMMPNAPLQTQPGLGFGRFSAPPAGTASMKVGAPTPLNPAAPPPGMQLNPNYVARAPGDNTKDLRPTDQMFVPTPRPAQGAMAPSVMPRMKGGNL